MTRRLHGSLLMMAAILLLGPALSRQSVAQVTVPDCVHPSASNNSHRRLGNVVTLSEFQSGRLVPKPYAIVPGSHTAPAAEKYKIIGPVSPADPYLNDFVLCQTPPAGENKPVGSDIDLIVVDESLLSASRTVSTGILVIGAVGVAVLGLLVGYWLGRRRRAVA